MFQRKKLLAFIVLLAACFIGYKWFITHSGLKFLIIETRTERLKLRKEFIEAFPWEREFFRYNCKNQVRIGHNEEAKKFNKGPLYRIDGGWFICMDNEFRLEKNACTIFSFGVNNDYTFDLEASQDYGCMVHSFDPFVVNKFFLDKAQKTPGDQRTIPMSDKWKFHKIGLTDRKNEKENGNPSMMSFDKILAYTGLANKTIDVFKMDIEGAEANLLSDMDTEYFCKYVKQFVLEVHTSPTVPSLLRSKLEPCFSLFRRDNRFFMGDTYAESGHLTEWQRPANNPFKLDISGFKNENGLAVVLFNWGELYFVNENFTSA